MHLKLENNFWRGGIILWILRFKLHKLKGPANKLNKDSFFDYHMLIWIKIQEVMRWKAVPIDEDDGHGTYPPGVATAWCLKQEFTDTTLGLEVEQNNCLYCRFWTISAILPSDMRIWFTSNTVWTTLKTAQGRHRCLSERVKGFWHMGQCLLPITGNCLVNYRLKLYRKGNNLLRQTFGEGFNYSALRQLIGSVHPALLLPINKLTRVKKV